MDFELSPEQREIQTLAHDFAAAEIEPHAAEWDREHRFPKEVFGKLAELGLMGACVPEEYGGAGADFLSYILVLEELSRADAGVGVTVGVHTSAVTLPILRFGTDEQRSRFVPPLARGELIGAFALTEAEAGSDAGSLRTAAEQNGDGWRITGTKQFISTAAHAGTFLLFARTDPSTPGARGVSAFILDSEHIRITGQEEKLGLNSSVTNSIAVEGAEVGSDRLLHEEGKGFTVAMATLDGGRIGIGAQALGIAQAAYDFARSYALERKQFGKAIAEFQAIQWKLADMATEIDASRLLVYRAAWRKEQGLPAHRGGREGQAVRVRDRAPRDRRGDPDPRRLRLHEGVPGRALLPGREDHGDLRGHERDPAARHRALDPRAPAARARAGLMDTAITLFLDDQAPELAKAHDELYPERIDEHIPLSLTLLYPFAPSDELDDDYLKMARDFFASRHPLSFDIARVAQWPDGGAVYGVPEPEGQLRATMRALWELFPEFPPYRGAVDDPRPHASLTLDGGDDPDTLLARVEERLAGLLPAHFEVGEAVLMEEHEPDVWHMTHTFPFQR